MPSTANSLLQTGASFIPGGSTVLGAFSGLSSMLGFGGKSKCPGPYNYDSRSGTCVPKNRAQGMGIVPYQQSTGLPLTSVVPGTSGSVVPGHDATPIGSTPAEVSMGEGGIISPSMDCVQTLKCPKFADGKRGILWMHVLSGEIVCLPRGVNGKGFGLVRKNQPRAKPYISAAEVKLLRKKDALTKKAKAFAGLTGQTCHAKGGRGR